MERCWKCSEDLYMDGSCPNGCPKPSLVQQKLNQAVEAVKPQLNKLQHNIQDFADSQQAIEVKEKAKDFVHDNPRLSIVGGAGALYLASGLAASFAGAVAAVAIPVAVAAGGVAYMNPEYGEKMKNTVKGFVQENPKTATAASTATAFMAATSAAAVVAEVAVAGAVVAALNPELASQGAQMITGKKKSTTTNNNDDDLIDACD